MAGMGTVGDTAVIGVTGPIRNHPAKEQSSRWQQRLMPSMATHPLHKTADTGMGADVGIIEMQISNMRRTDMSKPAHTHEHPSPEPKKQGCCGEGHAKDEKAQPAAQQQANPQGAPKHEHSNHSGGSSCCCGSGKASK